MAIRTVRAFLTGGFIGIIGQVLVKLCSLVVTDVTAVVMAAIFLFGVLSMFVVSSGLYNKVTRFGGNGAAIALCGLMNGAANAASACRKSGESIGKAALSGFLAVFKVLGTGFALCFLVGLLFH